MLALLPVLPTSRGDITLTPSGIDLTTVVVGSELFFNVICSLLLGYIVFVVSMVEFDNVDYTDPENKFGYKELVDIYSLSVCISDEFISLILAVSGASA